MSLTIIDKVNDIITAADADGGTQGVLDALDNIRNALSSANKNTD